MEQDGRRDRKPTEKGAALQLENLKKNRTAAYSALTKRRSELMSQMKDEHNLHHAKRLFEGVCDGFDQYKDEHMNYVAQLNEDDQIPEQEQFEKRQLAQLKFQNEVTEWICRAESNLSDTLSTAQSSRSGSASCHSSTSSRLRERAKIGELLAEKAMLKRKQALRAAEEEMNLELEIAKSHARENAYAEAENDDP